MTSGGWNKGMPSPNRGKSPAFLWLLDHQTHNDPECLIWPFSVDRGGYGLVRRCTRREGAHRVMCELVHGSPPDSGYQAAHSCGKGHLGCVNPCHLSWKTRSANRRDYTDSCDCGAPAYKLTEEDIKTIRDLLPTTTNSEIAKRFGVTFTHISKIRNGKVWRQKQSQQDY